jgi:hypothetical protein
MIEALQRPTGQEYLVLDFTHPIRTDRYLTVEMDLTAHGSDVVEVDLALPHSGRNQFPPRFVTAAPLRIPELTLRGIRGTETIDVETDRLIVGADTDLHLVRGTTRMLRQKIRAEIEPVPQGLQVTGRRLTFR